MVHLTVKVLEKVKIPEMRNPVPSFKHGYKKPEAIRRPTSATGAASLDVQIDSMKMSHLPKVDDPPSRAEFRKLMLACLTSLKNEGLFKAERIITTAQSSKINIKGNQLRIMNFCSNNYLGLSNNPEVVKYSKTIMGQYGAGMSSVRHLSGTQDIHKDLEKLISKFHGREDTLLYNSCYDANTGLFSSILTCEDAVFTDECSHASIKDGIALCQAKKHTYKHRNVNELEDMLKSCGARLKLIATNGVFPSDCTIAPLKEICELASKYKAITMLDDCHGTGIIGKTGLGTEEHCDVKGQIDIINSTLGKALGGAAGGYTTGPFELITLLRQKSRPYLFSNAISPAMVATGTVALEILTRSDALIKKMRDNTMNFRCKMQEAGFQILGDCHPMCPVVVGDNKTTAIFADKIQWRGVFVMPMLYPLTPKETPVIRVQISAAHTEDDINRAVEAFVYIGKMLNVIK